MSANTVPVAKFRLGRIVATQNAFARLTQEDILRGIGRHQAGDWGDVGEEDRKENEVSLTRRLRLFSVYHSSSGVQFWMITKADRLTTKVRLPKDS